MKFGIGNSSGTSHLNHLGEGKSIYLLNGFLKQERFEEARIYLRSNQMSLNSFLRVDLLQNQLLITSYLWCLSLEARYLFLQLLILCILIVQGPLHLGSPRLADRSSDGCRQQQRDQQNFFLHSGPVAEQVP